MSFSSHCCAYSSYSSPSLSAFGAQLDKALERALEVREGIGAKRSKKKKNASRASRTLRKETTATQAKDPLAVGFDNAFLIVILLTLG